MTSMQSQLARTIPLKNAKQAGPWAFFFVVAVNVLFPAGTFKAAPLGGSYTQITTATLLVWIFSRRDRIGPRAPATTLLTVYTILVSAMTLLSSSPQLFYLLVMPFAVFQYSLLWRASERTKERLQLLIVALGGIEAILALFEFQRNTGPLIGDFTSTDRTNFLLQGHFRTQGTLGHPLALSAILLAAFICVLTTTRLRPLVRVLVGILLISAAVTTGSATAIILGAIALAARIIANRHILKAMISALVVLGFVVLYAAQTSVWEKVNEEISGRNVLQRQNSMSAIPKLLSNQDTLNALFGNGLNASQDLYSRGILTNTGFYAVDNQFVSALISGGLVALVLFILAQIQMVRAARSIRFALLLICLLAVGLSFDYLYWYGPGITIFTVIALLVRPPTRSVRGGITTDSASNESSNIPLSGPSIAQVSSSRSHSGSRPRG